VSNENSIIDNCIEMKTENTCNKCKTGYQLI